jgi:hypothetical protein
VIAIAYRSLLGRFVVPRRQIRMTAVLLKGTGIRPGVGNDTVHTRSGVLSAFGFGGDGVLAVEATWTIESI